MPVKNWLVSNNEFSNSPEYDRILVKNVDETASTGKSTIKLIAGGYVIEVEIADGPWQITVAAKP